MVKEINAWINHTGGVIAAVNHPHVIFFWHKPAIKIPSAISTLAHVTNNTHLEGYLKKSLEERNRKEKNSYLLEADSKEEYSLADSNVVFGVKRETRFISSARIFQLKGCIKRETGSIPSCGLWLCKARAFVPVTFGSCSWRGLNPQYTPFSQFFGLSTLFSLSLSALRLWRSSAAGKPDISSAHENYLSVMIRKTRSHIPSSPRYFPFKKILLQTFHFHLVLLAPKALWNNNAGMMRSRTALSPVLFFTQNITPDNNSPPSCLNNRNCRLALANQPQCKKIYEETILPSNMIFHSNEIFFAKSFRTHTILFTTPLS